jgi:diadenylate cyclase
MFRNLDQILQSYQPLEIVIEMAIIWACVYLMVRFLRGTRGANVIQGFAVLLVVLTLAVRVVGESIGAFGRLTFIYDRFLGIVAILLIVVFQPELRQAMIRLGHARLFRAVSSRTSQVIDAVSDAVEFLSKSQFGALIAIERDVKLGGLAEGGQRIDADVSSRLLESIFWPNSPLHDLGVIIRGDRVIAASVQFPLAEDGSLPPTLGSRHRAALGLTLESDCVVVVVSEETGVISLAQDGRLEHNVDADSLRENLAKRLRAPPPAPPAPRAAEKLRVETDAPAGDEPLDTLAAEVDHAVPR